MQNKEINNTVLVIAPHPDDELSLAGTLICRLIRRGYRVKVFIVTNGDAETLAKIRLKESLHALRMLGVKGKDVIFGGYGNRWSGEKHIYNCEGKVVITSFAGYDRTYTSLRHREYHFNKYNKAALYTRDNIVNDMRECIEEINAGIIICVDFDSHPDHRAVSLLFEESMNSILKNTAYRPIVIKRFAYAFAWHGDPTTSAAERISRSRVFDNRFQLDNPYYNWKQRVVLRLHGGKCLNIRFRLAALAYRSQNGKAHIRRLQKKEYVFWDRRTDNLMYKASVSVSSGEKTFLTDFKRFDCTDVNCEKISDGFWNKCAWEPEQWDKDKMISAKWDMDMFICYVVLFPSISAESRILDCEIIINNSVYHTGELKVENERKIYINDKTSEVEIRIKEFEGESPGISEVEIFSEEKQTGLEQFLKSIELI